MIPFVLGCMSSKNLLESNHRSPLFRRYIVSPDTFYTWIIWTTVWMSTLFVSSMLLGVALNQPRNGASVGIFLSGMCVIFAIDSFGK